MYCTWFYCTFERLITAESFPKLYHDTAFVAGAIVIVYMLKDPVEKLLGRVIKNKNPWTGETDLIPLSLPRNPSKSSSPTAEPQGTSPTGAAASIPPAPAQIEYYKSAHFYWLGSDLMEAIQNVAFQPNREAVIRALSQSLRHFRKSGLRDTAIEQKFEWLIDLNNKRVVSEWVKETSRRDILNEILVVRQQISTLIDQKAGPDFKPWVG